MHKLGNAIRAHRFGMKWIKVGKTRLDGENLTGPRDTVFVSLPEKAAKERVERWLFRCRRKGDISESVADQIKNLLTKKAAA